jgi:tripartite-type tricarboxylate transporter receptor subunit TctC
MENPMQFTTIARMALAATTLAAGAAGAQSVATLVVPYPAGGPSDFVARTVQPDLQRGLGQTVIVDNVGGVSGALGIQKVLAAAADGQTMVLASPMELVLAPLTLKTVKHKPEELRPAAVMVSTTLVLAARKDLPAATLEELIEAQRKPGAKDLTYGSAGNGTLYHLAGESFARQAGLRMTHVPYKGTAPMVTDLLGGQIDVAFLPMAGNIPAMIKEGKLKAYGVTARQPHPLFPALPAIAAGKALDKLEFDLWAGIFVSARAPNAQLDKLNGAILQSLANPEVRKAFESTGNVVAKPMKPAELDKFYAAEIARYQAIAKALNVQPE